MNHFHSTFLISHKYRVIGYLLVGTAFLAYVFFVVQAMQSTPNTTFGEWISLFTFAGQEALTTRLIRSAFLAGMLIIITSKESQEDEWVQQIRTTSLSSTFIIQIIAISGYTFFGPTETERLISVNVWLNISMVVYIIIFKLNLRSGG